MTRTELINQTRRYLDGQRVRCIREAIQRTGRDAEFMAARAGYWKGFMDRLDAAPDADSAVQAVMQITRELAEDNRLARLVG